MNTSRRNWEADIGIAGARPVPVPWRLGFLATPLANLGRKIVRVKLGVGPRGAMYDAFQCSHLWPEVKGTEFLAWQASSAGEKSGVPCPIPSPPK